MYTWTEKINDKLTAPSYLLGETEFLQVMGYLPAVDDVMWVGEGTGRVAGTDELDEREAARPAGDAVLGQADVGHLAEAPEVAAELRVAGARRDTAHE